MNDISIHAEHLSKKYRIGERQQFRTFREALTDSLSAPIRQFIKVFQSPNLADHRDDTIWALRDVSFEIDRGEAVGIIGQNGSGKSTLLKILSRITEPTEGEARILGRVGSLLEVGTGFHPELTGRENIYLNGAILGMRRREIDHKFAEIVAFAEIEEFIDTPVKHYSSGMYMRLAFAVAAHLEPEILLVDEVLAVGDAAFQKKCLGKMGDVAREGRTVLFVSHNMGAIVQLCPQSILLHAGRVAAIGRSEIVVGQYLSNHVAPTTDVHLDPLASPQSAAVFTRLWIGDCDGNPISAVDVTKPFCVGLDFSVRQEVGDVDISMRFRNVFGQALFTTNLSDAERKLKTLHPGEYSFLIQIPAHFLAPDSYSLIVAIHRPGIKLIDVQDGVLAFQVVESGSTMWQYHGQAYGNILVQFHWQPNVV